METLNRNVFVWQMRTRKKNTYYRISASSTYIQFSNEIHFAIKLQTSHFNLLKTKYLFLETFQAKKNN